MWLGSNRPKRRGVFARSSASSCARLQTKAPPGFRFCHSAGRSRPSLRRPRALGLLGVALRSRQELRAAAAEHDLDAVAGAELDELARDVGDAGGARRARQVGVALPVALGHVRVAGARRRVRDARRGDDAGREAALLGVLEQRRARGSPRRCRRRHAREVGEAEHAGLGLHARDHRRHRAGGVGHLRVGVVGLREREVGQLLEGELVLLAAAAGPLPGEDARGGHRGRAHAVADEQDHVPRAAAARRERARLGDRLAPAWNQGSAARVASGSGACAAAASAPPSTSSTHASARYHPTCQSARFFSRPARMRPTMAPRSTCLVPAKACRGSSARRAASAMASDSSCPGATTRSR